MAELPSRGRVDWGRQSHPTKSGTCRLCGVCSGAWKRCHARSSFFTTLGSQACLLSLWEEEHAAFLPQDPQDPQDPARGGPDVPRPGVQLPPPEPRAPASPSANQDLRDAPTRTRCHGVSQPIRRSLSYTAMDEGLGRGPATPPTGLPSSAQRQDLNAPDKHRNAGRVLFFKSYS